MTETLHDAAGRPLATYEPGVREGRQLADYVVAAPGVGEEQLAAAIVERLPGWVVGTVDLSLGAELERRGARRRRFAHTMTIDLRTAAAIPGVPLPAGVALEPLVAIGDDLGAANTGAYPPGHPDHRTEDPAAAAAELRRIARGEEVGPLLACSRVAVRSRRQVGASLVTDSGGEPPDGGPWLVELFRAPGPDLRGLGAALLAATLHAARGDGLATLGLAVSDGIAARRLYDGFGLALVSSSITVFIPAPAAPPAPPTPR